ncbi:MAG: mechanosensitive ion channel protein MscS [Ignavibacteria bacterium]|nr:MAG: mechanosensitive ion channel protein MscS [Ignavibacteria bacterium]
MEQIPTLILGNSLLNWLIAIGSAIVLSVVLIVLKRLIARHFKRLAERTTTDIDDMLADLVGKLSPLFLIIVGMYAGSFWLQYSSGTQDIINHLLFAAGIIQMALLGNSVIVYLISKTTRLREYEDASAKTSLSVLSFLSKLVLWSVVVLVILDNLGFNITTLIASLGIGGIAVALAAQSILAELFASLSIAVDKPFVIGDFIVIDSFLGTIEKIGMRTTHIRSLGGELIVFSNTDLLKSRIRNYKRMEERRILFAIGVVYGTPADKVEIIPEYVRSIIEADEMTRFDRGHFKEYGAFSLNFEFVYYVLSPEYLDYMNTQQRINLAIYRKFEEEGIEFAFPTQTVHVQDGSRMKTAHGEENSHA